MENIHTNNEPLIFKELPKEQRKALQKEYAQTAEAKKLNRIFIIVAVLFAAIVIAGAVYSLLTDHDYPFATFPTFIICIFPAVISQNKFEKWLLDEKTILVKREK